jgi:trk system potassium uptake protein TrkA
MGKNSQDGNDVIAIDAGKARVQAVDRHASQAVVLDATNRGALKSLGFAQK